MASRFVFRPSAPADDGSHAALGSPPADSGSARASPSAAPSAPSFAPPSASYEALETAPPRQSTKPTFGGPRKRRPVPFERRVYLLCVLLVMPGLLVSFLMLWKTNTPWPVMAGALGFLALLVLIVLGALSEQIVRPLQTLANVAASLREGDYSFRARYCTSGDALGEVGLEINQLADLMQSHRLSELDATALLRNVVRSIDAPILAFDQGNILRWMNPATERVLGLVAERSLGRSAEELRLSALLNQPDQSVLVLGTKRNADRWMVRRSSFRQRGVPHTLLILADVSAALREQEREAWQRLIRVLGHEINNSLTPIKSIAATLRSRAQASETADSADFDRALRIIESRAESLNRFIQAYRQLAQLPQPVLRRAALRPLIERVAALETRVAITVQPGPDVFLEMDSDQVEQLMINLIRNAAEASLARSLEAQPHPFQPPTPPEVHLSWTVEGRLVEIVVADNGTGLSNPSNLFVPFYTTKSGGTGVGLALARQICEAHGGVIQLTNRPNGRGCEAHVRLRLPLRDAAD